MSSTLPGPAPSPPRSRRPAARGGRPVLCRAVRTHQGEPPGLARGGVADGDLCVSPGDDLLGPGVEGRVLDGHAGGRDVGARPRGGRIAGARLVGRGGVPRVRRLIPPGAGVPELGG